MGTRGKTSQTPQILSGWKSIASHLGMGVRTVQRYERELGLPVRRPAGKARGAVVATISELDAWVAASAIREAFELTKFSPDSQARNLAEVKLKLEKMGLLRDQMLALRSELKGSMALLMHSIVGLRGDLRPGNWEIPSLSVLDDNPQTRRLREWMFMQEKGRKV